MSDINTIKNLIYFFPYLKEETWYMIGMGVVIYAIYIAYLIAFERYYRLQQNTVLPYLSEEKSVHELLNSLSVDDVHFFERLSFIIRSHLENSHKVPLATKKTPRDIRGESVSPEFKEILEICTYYEYTKERAGEKEKADIMERLRGLL